MHVKRVALHRAATCVPTLTEVPGAGCGAHRLLDVARANPAVRHAGDPADEFISIDARRGNVAVALATYRNDAHHLGYVTPIQDSVSQTAARVPGKMFVGTVVSTVERSSAASGHEARLFTGDEFTERFGRSFKSSKDYIGVMNADGAAVSEYLHSVTYFPVSGNIWVGVPGSTEGSSIRLNYLVVLGD